MREVAVEEQIQWILSYVQGRLVDIWKENILEDLEAEKIEYKSTGDFLAEIKYNDLKLELRLHLGKDLRK